MNIRLITLPALVATISAHAAPPVRITTFQSAVCSRGRTHTAADRTDAKRCIRFSRDKPREPCAALVALLK